MNDKYDDICWYHGNMSRDEAEESLRNGKFNIINIIPVHVCF